MYYRRQEATAEISHDVIHCPDNVIICYPLFTNTGQLYSMYVWGMRIIKLTEHWGNLKEEAQNLSQGNMFFAIKKMLLRINQPDFHIHMSISEKKA